MVMIMILLCLSSLNAVISSNNILTFVQFLSSLNTMSDQRVLCLHCAKPLQATIYKTCDDCRDTNPGA